MDVLEKTTCFLIEKGLSAPCIIILDTIKPFSRIFSSMLIFTEPFMGVFIDSGKYEEMIKFLEDPQNIENIIKNLEINEFQ